MNIAFIGNFRVPHTTENDLVWSLGDLGHTVHTMQEDMWRTEDILEACQSRNIKLVFYVHTHSWVTPGAFSIEEMLKRLELLSIPTVSFHLDYWRGLAREGDVGQHPFWQTKYVFTADGGSHEWYKEKDINHFWLPPGVVKRDCYWAETRDAFNHEVIFVGSRGYHPEWAYRPQLIDWLKETYTYRFAHYGNDGLRTIRGLELNELYRSAKVVVGDSLCLGFKHHNYWSDRVPETLGRGGFLIHPKIKGMEDYFKDKEHLAYYDFGNFGQLKELIDHYLNHYLERERIRLNGHEYVKNNHTYTNRMSQVLDIVSGQEDKK